MAKGLQQLLKDDPSLTERISYDGFNERTAVSKNDGNLQEVYDAYNQKRAELALEQ